MPSQNRIIRKAPLPEQDRDEEYTTWKSKVRKENTRVDQGHGNTLSSPSSRTMYVQSTNMKSNTNGNQIDRTGDSNSHTSDRMDRYSTYHPERLVQTSDTSTKNRRITQRFQVSGFNNVQNEIYVSICMDHAMTSSMTSNNNDSNNITNEHKGQHCHDLVIFFPGDVQNYQHEMQRGPFADFIEYSYEHCVEYLAIKYPTAHIVLIKPSKIQNEMYSWYTHFVDIDENGDANIPYNPTGTAIQHLTLLLENASTILSTDHFTFRTQHVPIHLLGFSRGVIVLNQILTELGNQENNFRHTHSDPFFQQVQSLHYIDGGNGKRDGSVPCHDRAITAFSTYRQIQLYFHMTPYQLRSPLRPWIASEIQAFQYTLQTRNIPSFFNEYFQEDCPSLEQHFQVLKRI